MTQPVSTGTNLASKETQKLFNVCTELKLVKAVGDTRFLSIQLKR